MSDTQSIDAYDRVLGSLYDRPDVDQARPSTVQSVLPIIGRAQTHVVQTFREQKTGRYWIAVQLVDSEGRARIVLPDKVAAAIYRQAEQLLKRAKSRTGREKWEKRQQLRAVDSGER